ncbi:GNAT family protein [Aureibaculum sp. 2210JD6-5]|uniref:GNAT family N-acetyltransferase n=1 Tax=Aureibaculum sp. 2210JD6-5 TaxID=3103957 RepID=UPI002AACD521|nr:GNAT family protein [Aureibaculum sp. 2210JD6-5]MDY7393732.1 GNAT family protein [Aureibaculum sp. 2210JD6-5]
MQALFGNNTHLRALEPEDLDFLYAVENDASFWEVSSTQTPYSKNILKRYLANAHQDIYEAKQLRLVIAENKSNKTVGLIDLFDFNPQHKRAGIGILILENEQQKGFASEALELLIDYSFNKLNLHQLFANITTDNKKSIKLFKKHNFVKVGIKKEWIFTEGNFKDEVLFQLLNS